MRGVRNSPPNPPTIRRLVRALSIGVCLLAVTGCELRDDAGKGLHIEHHPPNVKVEVGPINLPAWRRNVDPRNCQCCAGERCLCGKTCTCRCER